MPAPDQEFLKRLRAAFQVEAGEHVQAMGAGLIELENGVALERQAVLVETIYREAHSLKGAARAVNASEIETVCQALETVFSRWKRKELAVQPAHFDAIQRAVTLVAELLVAPAGQGNKVAAIVKALGQAATAATAPVLAPSPPAEVPARAVEAAVPEPDPVTSTVPALPAMETVRIATDKLDAILFQAEEMLVVKLTAGQRATELRALRAEVRDVGRGWTQAERELRPLRRMLAGDPALAGAAALFDAHLGKVKSVEAKLRELSDAAGRDERMLGTLVDDLLENAKRLVMLPFARVLEGFPRLVRELARDEGKELQFSMRGQDVEIDKRILEEMKDPLLHILRNSVDHGIEAPAQRGAKGRRAAIELSVAPISAREVEVRVKDDGRGIDTAAVRAEAVRKGLVSEEEAARMDEAHALALVFQSDISTSPLITEISGRGLGLAIAREKVQKLGGRIAIETALGTGTTFRITLPLTLATLRGLSVCEAEQWFVVPMTQVDRVVRLAPGDIQTVENRETIALDGGVIPIVRLGDVLGLPRKPDPETAPTQGGRAKAFVPAILLGAGEKRIAFRVAEIGADQEVLVKPLGKPLARVRNVAGATVLADGRAVPILHVPDLLASALLVAAAPVAAAAGRLGAAPKRVPVLVAEDSITSRTLLKNILESAGYPVTTAVDGLDALATLRTGDFGLVVSDIDMPRLDGFGLTTAIRKEPRFSHLPVVLITARETREDRERGIDAGANAYIVKSSFDQSDLLQVIRRLL